ncbi:MAG TPA: S8 family serine peptidase [Bryobacteraceae bacterium]|nr:S8 family serine peptidase [Bryobacteraceae bacterium]
MRPLCILTTTALLCSSAIAQTHFPVADVSSSAYKGTLTKAPYAPPAQSTLTGQVQVAIKLTDPPLVVAVGANAKQNGIKMTAAQQQAYLAQLKQKQDAVMTQVRALGGVELGRVSKGHNAVMVSIDARMLTVLHGISGVTAIRPITDYTISAGVSLSGQPDLATTLTYVGGVAAHNSGYNGQGVRIAMLDTGIDYTHYNLGGSGNVADYNTAKAAAATTPPASLFPTTKVIGGYDFTGEVWPNGPLAPDPNPLDLNGHGTLTSDTAAGHSLDGIHFGAAPNAQLYAVKVCSSVASSCSGVAMAEGMDFALDPNHTGTLNNAVDIISMSIGGSFGQREDDVSEMFTDVVNFGIVGVVSAGNDGDIPYILAHPASTPEVLSLAATTSVVSYGIPLIVNSPASIAGTISNTATIDWAPVNTTVTANVVYVGRGCPAGSIGTGSPADTYLANPSGVIALIDRGACAVSLKVDRAVGTGGAIGVIIGLVAPGDAISFSNGGGTHFAPTLVITQAAATSIKTAVGTVNATMSPNNAISTATNVASYSSRGPNYSYNMLKPDMSAPGTIMGAAVGTGNGLVTESGTSFACPITAGSAAVLLSKNPSFAPLDVKALLLENAEPLVYNNALTQPGVLGPMSRVGGGELRVEKAVSSTTSVWDTSNPLAVSMSFGTYRLSANQTFKKKVAIRNYAATSRTYAISNTYRDAPNTTGFTLSFPSSVVVPANSSVSITVSATVTAASLPAWTLNGGAQGSNGELLNTVEYAGYLTVSDANDSVHLPWHILPHQSANVQVGAGPLVVGEDPVNLAVTNLSAPIAGPADVFSLTGTGVQFPPSVLPAPGSDYAVINLQSTGVRLVCIATCTTTPVYGVQFAVTTFGQRSHPDVPAEFDIYIDANNDGTPDFDIFNEDIGLATTGTTFSGQNGVFVADLAAGTATGPYFYTVADLDSANLILTAPLSALANSTASLATNSPFNFSVYTFDNYYTGNLTDEITGMQYELDMPRVFPAATSFSVPAGFSGSLSISPNGSYNGNSPSQKGLLFLYTHGKTGQESSEVPVTVESEAP